MDYGAHLENNIRGYTIRQQFVQLCPHSDESDSSTASKREINRTTDKSYHIKKAKHKSGLCYVIHGKNLTYFCGLCS